MLHSFFLNGALVVNLLIPAALLIFAAGFFPYKPFLSGIARYEDLDLGAPPSAPFDRLVFMVVDALRRLKNISLIHLSIPSFDMGLTFEFVSEVILFTPKAVDLNSPIGCPLHCIPKPPLVRTYRSSV